MTIDSEGFDLETTRARLAAEAPHGTTLADCQRTWRTLISGESRVVDAFATVERAYLVIARRPERKAAVRGRDLAILERALLGTSCKAIAIDLALSRSTVAASLKRSLELIGADTSPARVPLGLVVLVRVAHGASAHVLASSGIRCQGLACDVLSTALPDLTRVLPPAVSQVAQLRLQGKSHAEIAARRATSQRTVANQLATAFHQLGGSGMSGLLGYLIAMPIGERERAS